jgi:Putative peptidoglycan binding domain
MRRSLLVCIGSLGLALTAGAQSPYNHRTAPQRSATYSGSRGSTAVRHVMPHRTFSPAAYRQPVFSKARFRQPMSGATRLQPRLNNSFVNRPAMTGSAAWRQTRVGANNRWADSRFPERLRTNDSFLNRPDVRHAVSPPAARQPFNNGSTHFRSNERSSSFVNGSRSTAFWSGRRAAVTSNWRGSEFSGRQYGAFRNYRRQWHDSGWWHSHCSDRIVFVTVYSQPFPFYFDAGYWYPAWGYYPDSYYPYDGPIYGYNDLPPDEVIANVQTQLYNEGYYNGAIDGILGPDTRAAIADYQADHGLAVTAAVDEPTVESLGLT